MSDKAPPFDPFGSNDRTIIRPNPGGRRPEPAPAQRPVAPAMPSMPPPSPPLHQKDAWELSATPQAPLSMTPAFAETGQLRREQLLTPNSNIIMQAAGPLLLLLGRMRVALLKAPFAQLMEQVADAITAFEKEVRHAGVQHDVMQHAKYVLCATADDIVQNIPGDDRNLWTQYSMLSRFFQERVGGVRFFEYLEKAKADPAGNYDLLELHHVCLAMGFQGIHRTSAGGQATLQMIQRQVYELLRRAKRPNAELSPRWQGQSIAVTTQKFQVPIWAVGSLAGVALFGLYFLLQSLLGGQSEAVASALVDMHPRTEVGIQRRVFTAPPPPVPSSQISKVRAQLGPPLTIQESGNQITIRMANMALFAPGDARVRDEFKPLIARIAAVVEQEPGAVKVVGHTDSQPISNVRFPSNFHLSMERAKAVAALLRDGLSDKNRVSVEGKGADVAIAPNSTAEGRALNRRVEVIIQRSN
jgi:type VI secretion system protein ImpK